MTPAGTRATRIQQALIRAFLPGDPSLLRSVESVPWNGAKMTGERVVVSFDLPDVWARRRAFTLAASFMRDAPSTPTGCIRAPSDVPLPSATVVKLEARVKGDVLRVEALVAFDEVRR